MSQYGMHMPGGAMQRRPSMDVYTGLLFLAVVSLVAACLFVWIQGAKIAPPGAGGGNGLPLNLQSASGVSLPRPAQGQ